VPTRKNTSDEAGNTDDGNPRPRKRARSDYDCSYVDITLLLVLPQKEAAQKLGISESMLCKRFKECTRRKWPYRYIRKIEKMIRVLTLNKKSDGLPTEDQEKIQRLKKEKEECLRPVKIRITGSDKIQSFPNGDKSENFKNLEDTESDNEDNHAAFSDVDLGEEEVVGVENNYLTNHANNTVPVDIDHLSNPFIESVGPSAVPVPRVAQPSAFYPIGHTQTRQMAPPQIVNMKEPSPTNQELRQERISSHSQISFLLNVTPYFPTHDAFQNVQPPPASSEPATMQTDDLTDIAATLNLLRSGPP